MCYSLSPDPIFLIPVKQFTILNCGAAELFDVFWLVDI